MKIRIPDRYAFWRWPGIIRRLKVELKQAREERDKALTAQAKLLEWIKVSHGLNLTRLPRAQFFPTQNAARS